MKTEVKKQGIFEEMKENVIMELIENAIPKIQPFLAPAVEKMNEFFGDDEKIIIVRKNKNQKARVLIFTNTNDGEYEIKKSKSGNVFTADPEVVVGVYEIEEFVTNIVSGDMFKK